MFGGSQDWNPRAVLLAEVLHIYEQQLCPDCSQHSQFAFDPMNTGHFKVNDSVVCLGCEALEHFRERGGDVWPGTKIFITNDVGVTDGGS